MRQLEEAREEKVLLERRCTLLASESEESRVALEAAERARKALETELQENTEKFNELNNQVTQSITGYLFLFVLCPFILFIHAIYENINC